MAEDEELDLTVSSTESNYTGVFGLPVAHAADGERLAQGIDSLYAHAVQTNRFLKSLGVIFGTGVHFA